MCLNRDTQHEEQQQLQRELLRVTEEDEVGDHVTTLFLSYSVVRELLHVSCLPDKEIPR